MCSFSSVFPQFELGDTAEDIERRRREREEMDEREKRELEEEAIVELLKQHQKLYDKTMIVSKTSRRKNDFGSS